MSVLEENIKRVNNKLQELLKQYQLSQKQNEILKRKITEMKSDRDNDAQLIDKLEQQVGILKSATGQLNEGDKKIFEKNIDQYIKEIDKCLRLLSE